MALLLELQLLLEQGVDSHVILIVLTVIYRIYNSCNEIFDLLLLCWSVSYDNNNNNNYMVVGVNNWQ